MGWGSKGFSKQPKRNSGSQAVTRTEAHGAEASSREPRPHAAVISPVVLVAVVEDTPLSSLELRFRGRGLYSRLGSADMPDILKHTVEDESGI